MIISDYVQLFAGTLVVVSLALAVFSSQYWLFLTLFVGLNLMQSSITKFCPLAIILKKVGIKEVR